MRLPVDSATPASKRTTVRTRDPTVVFSANYVLLFLHNIKNARLHDLNARDPLITNQIYTATETKPAHLLYLNAG